MIKKFISRLLGKGATAAAPATSMGVRGSRRAATRLN